MKSALILLILAILPVLSLAQSSDKINVSLQLGMNTSAFSDRIGPFGDGEKYFYSEYVRYSPKIGIGSSYVINRLYSVQTELNYSAQGGSYRIDSKEIRNRSGEANYEYFYKNYRVDYIEVPLLFTVNLSNVIHKDYPEGKIHATLSGGAAISFNTSSTLRSNGFEPAGSSDYASIEEEYDVEEIGYARNNVSYVLNFGMNFFIKKLPAFVNLRYQRTLLDVYSIDELDDFNMQTKMGTLSVLVGVVFKKKD